MIFKDCEYLKASKMEAFFALFLMLYCLKKNYIICSFVANPI